MNRTVLTIALLFGAATLTSPALALPADRQTEPRRIHVAHGDLDLSSPVGVARLDRRLDHAIALACATPGSPELPNAMLVRRCRAAGRLSIAPRREAVIAAFRARRAQLASVR